jgi:hypothetical protein
MNRTFEKKSIDNSDNRDDLIKSVDNKANRDEIKDE